MRNDFLERIHQSVPIHKDIVWHIARSIKNPVTSEILLGDKRIRLHSLTCDDDDTSFKMNYIFQNIIQSDPNSYFCILDDDTLFHPKMYTLYKRYKRKKDKFMAIGRQQDKYGEVRLPATLPFECAIDSGNVLCHSHVLVPERWPDKHWGDEFHADFDFWNRCYSHFRLTHTDLIQYPISIYNSFSEKPDTLNYVR